MSRPDARPEVDEGRADGDDDAPGEGTIGGDSMVCRNDGPDAAAFTAVRRRDGRTVGDGFELEPGEAVALTVPDGDGQVTVEIDAAGTMATTTFDAAERPPLFVYLGDAVLVVRD